MTEEVGKSRKHSEIFDNQVNLIADNVEKVNTVQDLKKMSEEVGETGELTEIFETQLELKTVKDDHCEVVEDTAKVLEQSHGTVDKNGKSIRMFENPREIETVIEDTVICEEKLSGKNGENGDLTELSEKSIELETDNHGQVEQVENTGEDLIQNGESIKIFEKVEIKTGECGHLEVLEDIINTEETVSGKVDKNEASVGILESQTKIKPDDADHLEVAGDTIKDLEKMSEEVGKHWELMEIFEKPMELITANDGHLEVVDDTVNALEKIESPLNIVAIAGLYRTGKSYLMNRLAGKTTGFILGSSIESSTKGIWAWCRRHPTKESQVLLLLDTEGLGDVKKGSIDQDNKIFTLATLLSSTLVFNTMSAFNQDAVEKLTYITMLSKNMKVTSSSSSDELFDCIMPHFVLCLRDFTLELRIDGKEITADEYLEDCLQTKEVKTPTDEKYNRPRDCIKKYFTRRKVFTFDRPAGRSIMRHLETARDKDLNEDFVLETEKFISYVYDCPEKVLLNKLPVTGSMLAKILRVYVKAMNEGSVPCVEDAMMTMSRLENDRHIRNVVEEYKALLKQIQLPVFDKKELLKSNFEYQGDTLSKLHSKLLFDTDNKKEKATKAEMQSLYEALDKQNGDLLYKHCVDAIHEMYMKSVKTNIEKKKYAFAGGHTIYNADMNELFEEYNKKLEIIDFAERQRALNEFQNEMLSQSKRIMDEDKTYSEKETKESITVQLESIKQDFKEIQIEENKKLKMEFDNERKRYQYEMENIRKEEREREKRKIAKLEEEAWAARNAHEKDLQRIAQFQFEEMLRREQREREQSWSRCILS